MAVSVGSVSPYPVDGLVELNSGTVATDTAIIEYINTVAAPFMHRASCNIDLTSEEAVLVQGYGIQSVNRVGTGHVRVNLITNSHYNNGTFPIATVKGNFGLMTTISVIDSNTLDVYVSLFDGLRVNQGFYLVVS